jgi:O-antigen ligase
MSELIWRLRTTSRRRPGGRGGDLWWLLGVGGAGALVLGWALTVSLQVALAFVLVLAVIALHQYDRQWGIAALFALWFLAPGLRRVVGLMTGYIEHDPLSLAPFLATAALAALELVHVHVPHRIRRVLLIAAAGFVIGLPVGLVSGASSAVYAFIAYLAAISGAVLGLAERTSLQASTLRRVLLYGLPPIAAYAISQRVLPLPSWDRAWVTATELLSVGAAEDGKIRVFGTLNHPGALAPLLALSLLCYLTIKRAQKITIVGAVLVAVALELTLVRGAWVALMLAGIAHVVASGGRSARVVFGAAAVVVVATIALSPVSQTAQDVVDRFKSITDRTDTSVEERSATVSETLPSAVAAPIGHGLGSAGEPTKLTGDSELRAPDNGYLSLIYQVGPIGFVLVLGAVAYVFALAWDGAQARAPGQEMRLLLFAMLVYLLVLLYVGDAFYGVVGTIFWFICGQVLAYDYRMRSAGGPSPAPALAAERPPTPIPRDLR